MFKTINEYVPLEAAIAVAVILLTITALFGLMLLKLVLFGPPEKERAYFVCRDGEVYQYLGDDVYQQWQEDRKTPCKEVKLEKEVESGSN